jgi:Zn ribbon nucleic-acid-binding protein
MDVNPYVDKRKSVYKYGEFFPSDLSPFAYNETIAQEFYPKTKEEIISQGFNFREPETKNYIPTVKAGYIPDNISDVPEEFSKEILECKNKGKIETQCTLAFRIMPEELSFYKKQKIPIPEYCPNCRHYARLAKHLPPKIFNRICVKCGSNMKTSYSTDRSEIVYCDNCYKKEIY